jgi:chromosomal replication initiator protein
MKVDETDAIRLDHSAEEIWEQALAFIEKQVPKPTFEAWIRPLRFKLDGDEACVIVANDFAKSVCSGKHLDLISNALDRAVGRALNTTIVVDESIQSTAGDYAPSIAAITVSVPIYGTVGGAPESAPPRGTTSGGAFEQEMRVQATNLNPKNTLESFIVGANNRFCHSAACAVADRPGQTYNPLFMYGGVGLGKTHLMQAIGHQVMMTNPRMIVRYVTSEKFTNDVVSSIRENNMIDFRKRYRQVDVLLIDDIQFIGGKDATQEEFFHTFNALRESGRQIVLSSDRPPKEIAKLEERLRSRFEWGLIADIQPPDLETRLAILQKKCEAERMQVSDQVLEYIASAFTNNIRELEGALLRAHAYASLTGSPLNLQTASTVLQIGTPVSSQPNLSVENILGAVAAHYKVDTSDLRSQKRSQDLAVPRHIAMFLVHDLLKLSHSRIGEYFGNRKHSSVIYAIDKVKGELAENVQLSHTIQQIRRQLSN